MSPPRISYIYNPQNQSDEELLDNFVIRTRELNRIVKTLERGDLTTPPQHFLVEGQRGTGKTSLLLRLRYEIEHNDTLRDDLIAVQFAEEQYNIFDLCRLWESAGGKPSRSRQGSKRLGDELEAMGEDDDYALTCFHALEKRLNATDKRLVLLLDNFGDVLKRLSERETGRLRDIFHTSTRIQLIAASARTLEATYKHDQPFYEFFKIIRLEGLSRDETTALLTRLGTSAQRDLSKVNANRIEIIRRLTGGIPRTIVLLFEILIDNSADVFEDLELILDRVTPLYKHRMDDLPRQQQAIIDTMAMHWDGMTAAEIVAGLKKRGFDTRKVASQLNLLERSDLITSRMIDKKNKLYLISERFFNIWYLMRYGRRKKRTQVLWLVKFLQEWCDEEEIVRRAQGHIRQARMKKLHARGGYYMAVALASVVTDDELQHTLISETRKVLMEQEPSLAKKMSASDRELMEQAASAFNDKDYTAALQHLKSIQNKDQRVDFAMGFIYHMLNDFKSAIRYYTLAVDKGHADAMNNLGLLYKTEYKDFDAAIRYYTLVVDKGDADAMYNLALLYETEYKDFDAAIRYYTLAVDKGDAGAMNNLAFLYYQLQTNNSESLALSERSMAIQKKPQILYTLATVQLWNDRFSASLTSFRELIETYDYTPHINDMIDYFTLLLAKKQIHAAYDLFETHPQLQDQLKPLYYTVLTLLKEEKPKAYLRMGGELEETVAEILARVEAKRTALV